MLSWDSGPVHRLQHPESQGAARARPLVPPLLSLIRLYDYQAKTRMRIEVILSQIESDVSWAGRPCTIAHHQAAVAFLLKTLSHGIN